MLNKKIKFKKKHKKNNISLINSYFRLNKLKLKEIKNHLKNI